MPGLIRLLTRQWPVRIQGKREETHEIKSDHGSGADDIDARDRRALRRDPRVNATADPEQANPQRTVLPHHRMAKVLYSHLRVGARCVCVLVRVMRCTACGAELILTNVVPDETATVRGVERHTFVCSQCHVTEHRIVFIKDGRETDSPPMPMQAAQSIKPAPRVQDEHVSAPGLLGRVMARLRGH